MAAKHVGDVYARRVLADKGGVGVVVVFEHVDARVGRQPGKRLDRAGEGLAPGNWQAGLREHGLAEGAIGFQAVAEGAAADHAVAVGAQGILHRALADAFEQQQAIPPHPG